MREDSPSKFREATNFWWGLSGFYRKIDDDLDDYF